MTEQLSWKLVFLCSLYPSMTVTLEGVYCLDSVLPPAEGVQSLFVASVEGCVYSAATILLFVLRSCRSFFVDMASFIARP